MEHLYTVVLTRKTWSMTCYRYNRSGTCGNCSLWRMEELAWATCPTPRSVPYSPTVAAATVLNGAPPLGLCQPSHSLQDPQCTILPGRAQFARSSQDTDPSYLSSSLPTIAPAISSTPLNYNPPVPEPDIRSHALPSLDSILGVSTPTLHHIPNGARDPWVGVLEDHFSSICQDPSYLYLWCKLYAPSLYLCQFHKGRVHTMAWDPECCEVSHQEVAG